MAPAKSFSNEMWLIQIRALRKKLQLTLRRKEVSERERREGGKCEWVCEPFGCWSVYVCEALWYEVL